MAIDTQQARLDIKLAKTALYSATRRLERAMMILPPFSEQVRELGSISSDALDLSARLEKVLND